MNAETLKKLNDLQKEIQDLNKGIDVAKRYPISYRCAGYESWYNLPTKLVPELEDSLKEWILDQMQEQVYDLETKMANLTICSKSNETRYDPITL